MYNQYLERVWTYLTCPRYPHRQVLTIAGYMVLLIGFSLGIRVVSAQTSTVFQPFVATPHRIASSNPFRPPQYLNVANRLTLNSGSGALEFVQTPVEPPPLTEVEQLKAALVLKQNEIRTLTKENGDLANQLQELKFQMTLREGTPIRDNYLYDWATGKFQPKPAPELNTPR